LLRFNAFPKVDRIELSSNGGILVRLSEVGAHVTLEVEVGELISGLELEESRKLLVGVDLATILLVLEVIRANVLVDVASNLRPGHLGTSRLLEETSQLVTDEGGLDESRGSAVSGLALALNTLLLGSLELASPLLLEGAVLGLERGNKGAELLELGKELDRLVGKGRLVSSGLGNRSSLNRGRLVNLGGLHLLLLRGSGRGGGDNRGGGSGSRLGSRLGHFIIHIYMITF
jgi:hypothetical protein